MKQKIVIAGKQEEAWNYLTDKTTNNILYGGAAGGGKSFLGCIWSVVLCTTYPGVRGLMGRAKISNLEQSTFVTFQRVSEMLGYKGDWKYNSHKHIITWRNGSEIILKDLFQYPSDPDFISLGSTEYSFAFIDEVTEIKQKAVDLVASRIRWRLDDFDMIPKLLMGCNPGPGWVKDHWIGTLKNPAKLAPHEKYVQALVTDNPDRGFVKLYKGQLEKLSSDYDRQRLLHGNWEVGAEVKNPFAHQYDELYHEENVHMVAELPIIISVDFNLNPFAVTFHHFFQNSNGWNHWIFDEASIAKGSIPDMIDLIKARYGQLLHLATITGDPAGRAGQLSDRENASYYLQLQRGLGISPHQVKVKRKAPTHSSSRSDVNYVLMQSKQPVSNFHFKINPENCPNTVSDFKNVQCDAFGKLIKGNRGDLTQRADFLDTVRYAMDLVWPKLIHQHQK